MTNHNRHAFGLSARASTADEFADLYTSSECLFNLDNGGSRTFVLTDQNGVDFLAIVDGLDSGAIVVELPDAHESVHRHAREVLNGVF